MPAFNDALKQPQAGDSDAQFEAKLEPHYYQNLFGVSGIKYSLKVTLVDGGPASVTRIVVNSREGQKGCDLKRDEVLREAQDAAPTELLEVLLDALHQTERE